MMSIAQWHEVFNIVFIAFAILLISIQVLCKTSEFVRNYKKMKARLRRYERLMKMGGNLYV